MRKKIAERLESEFATLIRDESDATRALRIQVNAFISSLRYGADKLCEDTEKITLFRGQGMAINFKDQANRLFTASDSILLNIGYPFQFPYLSDSQIGGIKGSSWEDLSVQRRATRKDISIFDTIKKFASAETISSRTQQPVGSQLSQFDFNQLAERHSEGAVGSPYLSVTAVPSVAELFGPPFLTVKVCPSRLGVAPSSVEYEREGLILGATFPEEFVSLEAKEGADLQRVLAGAQSGSKTPSSEQLNWLESKLQDMRSTFQRAHSQFKPHGRWGECLAGFPVPLNKQTKFQQEKINSDYGRQRPKIAELWSEFATSPEEAHDEQFKFCSCPEWVRRVNENLTSDQKVDSASVCE